MVEIILKFEEEDFENYKKDAKWWNQSIEEYMQLAVRLEYKRNKRPEFTEAEEGFFNLLVK